jgi:hypothetical protein
MTKRHKSNSITNEALPMPAVYDPNCGPAQSDHMLTSYLASPATSEDHPVPAGQWHEAIRILDDSLAGLLSLSPANIREYASGKRPTPSTVTARLHCVVSVLSDLSGAFNESGMRRWFERPRERLGGKSPTEILTGEWDPNGPEAKSVRDLASLSKTS